MSEGAGSNKGWFARQHIAVQGIVVVSGVVLTGLAVWQGWKFIKTQTDSKKSKENVINAQSTLNTLSNQGIRPTYQPVQYTSWANTLQQAFEGCGVGWQNTKSIFASMKNDADVAKLIAEYGTRTVDKCGIGTGDFTGDLPSTLSYKYSGFEASQAATVGASVAAINKLMRANGVSFQF